MKKMYTYFNLAFMRAVTLSEEKKGPLVRISSAFDTFLKISWMSVSLLMTICIDVLLSAWDQRCHK
mgnify:CR=1 FL=1